MSRFLHQRVKIWTFVPRLCNLHNLLCFFFAGIHGWWSRRGRCSSRRGGAGGRRRGRRRRKRVWIVDESLPPLCLLNHLDQAVSHKHDDDGGYGETWEGERYETRFRRKAPIKVVRLLRQRLPLRNRRLATNLAKSKLFKASVLYKTMLQKLKTLKTALIRRDAAADIVVCGGVGTTSSSSIKRTEFVQLTGNLEKPTSTEAKGSMEKNFSIHNSKLRPKQLKNAQISTAGQGPSQMRVTPKVHRVATSSSSTLLCFPPR